MRKQKLCMLSAIALLSLGSCSYENTMPDSKEISNEETKGMTEFAVENTTSLSKSRTTGIYNGNGISFFWTQGDKLWINAGSSSLVQSEKDDINSSMTSLHDTKAPKAKFYFTGTYTANSYPVRYTGNGNANGDNITIKTEQEQKDPNDARHIGTDGDCGTAVAVRGGGKYTFTLSHKASYITFTPYYSHVFADDVKITSIKITANEALAGEFRFNDEGIDLTTRPTPNASNRSITLKLNGTVGFPIPTQAEYTKNAAIIVLAPGVYHNFTVEYFLKDSKTNVSGSVSKNYETLTFNPGKNKNVSADLTVPHYKQDIFYMWDAAVGQHTWAGNENFQPRFNENSDGDHYPKAGDSRWFNTTNHPNAASRSAKDCPNANELLWYNREGDPHWDTSLWSLMDHLYQGGMWLRKIDVIAKKQRKTVQQLKNLAPNNIDFTKNSSTNIYDQIAESNTNITIGKPTNTSDYIFLPATGLYIYSIGKLTGVGKMGYYWSSTPRSYNNNNAFNIKVTEKEVHTGYGNRDNSHCLWPK